MFNFKSHSSDQLCIFSRASCSLTLSSLFAMCLLILASSAKRLTCANFSIISRMRGNPAFTSVLTSYVSLHTANVVIAGIGTGTRWKVQHPSHHDAVAARQNESLLPLTDSDDALAQRMLNIPYRIIMVIRPFILLGLAAEYRSPRWMWSTVVWGPSEVYDTHWQIKLTVPETISRSRDMVGAH